MAVRSLRNRGYSLIELLVSMGILAVLTAVAIPKLEMRRENINTASRDLMANVRWARSKAITTGDHYCIHRTSTGYQVRRWLPSGSVKNLRTVTLPAGVSFEESWYHFKFNTRGMQLATSPLSNGSETGTVTPVSLKMIDGYSAYTEVSVWPSGQVYDERQ